LISGTKMTPLSLQLYSLRRETELNAEQTLRQVPSLGYKAVELFSDYGWPANKWQEMLAETGLAVTAQHIMLPDLETKLDKALEFQKKLGNTTLVLPWLAENWRTVKGYQEVARLLNAKAAKLRDSGFSLLYHHHDFEFAPLPHGLTGFEILIEQTDPDLISFEIDTFWVDRVGMESLEFFEKYQQRTRIIHAKDFRRRDQEGVACGLGDVNFRSIVPMALKNKWPIVVEYEGENAIDTVRQSARFLSQLYQPNSS
jgi:sugar phosphate isomerase/epimerase